MNIRARFVLSLTVGVLFVNGCHSWSTQDHHDECRPAASPHAPIVCVDNTGSALSVDPYRVVAYDEYPKDSGRPVVILFVTQEKPAEFKLVEKTSGCIEKQNCVTSAGLCQVTVKRLGGAPGKVCEYGIEMVGFPTMDPEIKLKPCC